MSEDNRRNRPTLADIARAAGVSIASVSRVLNNVSPISGELRARVESAVGELGYEGKRSSASLQRAVVAIIGDAHNTYFFDIVSGITDQATRHGILVVVVESRADPAFSDRLFQWIGRAPALGVIVCISDAIPEEACIRFRKAQGVPVVVLNRSARMAGIPGVRIDYERAMDTAVRHVVSFRHRRIAFLNGPEEAYSSVAKRLGVEKTLHALGFDLLPEFHITQPPTIEGGFRAMNELLALPPKRRPTAVIATSDLMALGAMHAIRSQGLSIPQDISVVGFDNIAMAAHANPPLTTISPPKFEMGSQAMQIILRQTDTEPALPEEYVVMESPLIVRESSGPCSE